MTGYLFVGSAAVMAAVALLFIFHEDYDDCLMGRIALSVLAVSGLVTVAQWWNSWHWEPSANTIGLLVGAAAFMAWLAFRFLRRQRQSRRDPPPATARRRGRA